MSTNKRSARKPLKQLLQYYRHLPVVLVFVGLMLIGHSQHQQRQWRLAAQAAGSNANYNLEQRNFLTTPVQLTIPDIASLAVSPATYQNSEWSVTEDTANYLVSSALPGENGNIIVYGHNTKSVLGSLSRIEVGDEILLTLKNGVVRTYTVQLTKQVSATAVEYLQPTEQETLTLYTCAGFLDRERLVVQAVL